MENFERGAAIKAALTLEAHSRFTSKHSQWSKGVLKILVRNGFSEAARRIIHDLNIPFSYSEKPSKCFLCDDSFRHINYLAEQAWLQLSCYDYKSFLVGITLPVSVGEREDEFKARFNVCHSENMRNEFTRLIGKRLAKLTGKSVEHRTPQVVVLINPLTRTISLQINPLYLRGSYRKFVRGIPQSKWFCSECKGKGCEKCSWTGKMYSESVEEIIGQPVLDATLGVKSSFHASGREDIDARMLGDGRPFILEITKPKKRFLNLDELEKIINAYGKDKVKVSNLRIVNREAIRKLKIGESSQKEYLVNIKFENALTPDDLCKLEERLTNTMIKQRTPKRVSHRRSDLTREKYIYQVKVKKLSPKEAEMRIRCQGGLYVKELITGDDGRTQPNVSAILKNEAVPINLDVINIIMED
jgi:tRNA pseudouridine synthase 10